MEQPDPLPPGKLIELCEEMYVTFNSGQMTLDAHADNCLSKWKKVVTDENDATFIKQVFYGCVRYKKFIKSFLAAFYFKNSGTALRSDINLYVLWVYIAFIRLEELTFPSFARLLNSQDPQKMMVLFKWIFEGNNLIEYCKEEWLKIYDVPWVDACIEGVLVFKPDISGVMTVMEEKVLLAKKKEEEEANAWAAGAPAGNTVPEPFNLSVSRPRPLPPDDDPPPPPPPKPVPRMVPGEMTKEMVAIAEIREANKATLTRPKPFRLATKERPMNIDRVRAEVEEERANELASTARAAPARPAPAPPTVEVRLNAAAVLREDALYKKKQQEEADSLKLYEQELRDAATFERWRKEQDRLEAEHRKQELLDRKREMEESAVLAKEARERQVAENHAEAEILKAQTKRDEAELAARAEELVRLNQGKREQVVEFKVELKKKEEAFLQEKKVHATQMLQERKAEEKALAQAREEELKRKRELILQLRALEKVPSSEKKAVYDPADTAGDAIYRSGLLEEMSLVELRERLAAAKQHKKEEEEMARERITKQRNKKDAELIAKAEGVRRVRDLAARSAAARRDGASATAAQARADHRAEAEASEIALREKLRKQHEAKEAEARRLAKEAKRIRFEQEVLATRKGQGEELKFAALSKGFEREAVARQTEAKTEALIYEATKAKANDMRITNVKRAQRAKRDFLKDYDERMAAMTQLNHQSNEATAAKKRDMVHDEQYRLTNAVAGMPVESNTHWVSKQEEHLSRTGHLNATSAAAEEVANLPEMMVGEE